MNNEPVDKETRQERREKRLKKKRERIPQHGRSLVKIYMNAVLKKLRGRGK
jgi:hypothetical protein